MAGVQLLLPWRPWRQADLPRRQGQEALLLLLTCLKHELPFSDVCGGVSLRPSPNPSLNTHFASWLALVPHKNWPGNLAHPASPLPPSLALTLTLTLTGEGGKLTEEGGVVEEDGEGGKEGRKEGWNSFVRQDGVGRNRHPPPFLPAGRGVTSSVSLSLSLLTLGMLPVAMSGGGGGGGLCPAMLHFCIWDILLLPTFISTDSQINMLISLCFLNIILLSSLTTFSFCVTNHNFPKIF